MRSALLAVAALAILARVGQFSEIGRVVRQGHLEAHWLETEPICKHQPISQSAWQDFKATHAKSYADPLEDELHRAIYALRALALIDSTGCQVEEFPADLDLPIEGARVARSIEEIGCGSTFGEWSKRLGREYASSTEAQLRRGVYTSFCLHKKVHNEEVCGIANSELASVPVENRDRTIEEVERQQEDTGAEANSIQEAAHSSNGSSLSTLHYTMGLGELTERSVSKPVVRSFGSPLVKVAPRKLINARVLVDRKPRCAATIIDSLHVLTVASCIFDELRLELLDATRLIVEIEDKEGRFLREDELDENGLVKCPSQFRYDVSWAEAPRTYSHGEYGTIDDIAVLALKTTIDFRDLPKQNKSTIALLPKKREWYRVGEEFAFGIEPKLRSKILADTECLYLKRGRPEAFASGLSFCAQYLVPTERSCDVLDGAPLVRERNDGRLDLIGLLSFRMIEECKKMDNYPITYVKVAAYLDFIRNHVKLGKQRAQKYRPNMYAAVTN